MSEEITAEFLGEQHRWDQTIIGLARPPRNGSTFAPQPIVVKATAEEGELTAGVLYRWFGRWTHHPRHGDQFLAQSFVATTPHDRRAVVAYLRRAPHIGQATAAKLWNEFEGDAILIARTDPRRASEAVGRGFNLDRAFDVSEFLAERESHEDLHAELMGLFDGRGFPRDSINQAIARWKNRAPELIGRNPYLLMQIKGVGFNLADRLYLELGGNPNRLKRQTLCVSHAMASDMGGHTWHPTEFAKKTLEEKIAGASVKVVRAVRLGVRAHLLRPRRDKADKLWLADESRAKNEQTVADVITAARSEPVEWPSLDGLAVSPHQLDRLQAALSGTIGILSGSPGTGKTYTAAVLALRIIQQHGLDAIAVAAPTGKASVRATELMQQHGVPITATTIHRQLGVERVDGGRWRFHYGPSRPLPHKFILVDESSMVDTDLMASLLSARAPGTHILFIGDPGQLAPVGSGAPLRDMIGAGVPCGELREILRNSGAIVETCASIRDGKPFDLESRFDFAAGRNMKILTTPTAAGGVGAILDELRNIRRSGKLDPVWDCQVLAAVNDRSPVSRRHLNRALREEFNPDGKTVPGRVPFRTDDKIICLKNSLLTCEDADEQAVYTDQGKVYVANGELAQVTNVFAAYFIAELSSPKRVVRVPVGSRSDKDANGGSGCQFDLGYAITVHRAQGSEWPVVIVVLDDAYGANFVTNRAWIYTAVSRAKRACILIGKPSTAAAMCGRNEIHERKTFLKELVKDAIRT